MTSIEINETCDTARVTISWDAVCQRYAARFCEQFQGKRKIHFDTLPDDMRTVDGAKTKWMLLVMLDAMIYFLSNDSPIDSARRYFHQQRELCDAIMAEISLAAEYLQMQTKNNTVSSGDIIHITTGVQELSYPWDNLNSFRAFHYKSTPTKAKKKFLAIVKHLSSHTSMEAYDFDLSRIVHQVLVKVMSSQGLFEDTKEKCCNEEASSPSTIGEENISTSTSSLSQSFHMHRPGSSLTSSPSLSSDAATNHHSQDAYTTIQNIFHSEELKDVNEKRGSRKSHAKSPLLSMFKPGRPNKSVPAKSISTQYSKQKASVSFLKFHHFCPCETQRSLVTSNQSSSHFMCDMFDVSSDSEDDDYSFPLVHSANKGEDGNMDHFQLGCERSNEFCDINVKSREEQSMSSAMDDDPHNTNKCYSPHSDINRQFSQRINEKESGAEFFQWDVLTEDLDTFLPAESMFLGENGFEDDLHDDRIMDMNAGANNNNEANQERSYYYSHNIQTSPIPCSSHVCTQIPTHMDRNSTAQIEGRDSLYRDMMDMSKSIQAMSSCKSKNGRPYFSIQLVRKNDRSVGRLPNALPPSHRNYHPSQYLNNNNTTNHNNRNSSSDSYSTDFGNTASKTSRKYHQNLPPSSAAYIGNRQSYGFNICPTGTLNDDGHNENYKTVVIKTARK